MNIEKKILVLGVMLAGLQLTAWADKPSWAGEGHGKHGHESRDEYARGGERGYERGPERRDEYFDRDSRGIIFDYYQDQGRSGHCPPGLAKKNNGCQAPGQAKKWAKGQALPRDVRYYELPPQLVGRLPRLPAGQSYVQVAGDILVIAVSTSRVLDALEDIFR